MNDLNDFALGGLISMNDFEKECITCNLLQHSKRRDNRGLKRQQLQLEDNLSCMFLSGWPKIQLCYVMLRCVIRAGTWKGVPCYKVMMWLLFNLTTGLTDREHIHRSCYIIADFRLRFQACNYCRSLQWFKDQLHSFTVGILMWNDVNDLRYSCVLWLKNSVLFSGHVWGSAILRTWQSRHIGSLTLLPWQTARMRGWACQV